MSDHPVAGRGVGGFQVEVEAHRRAARADAVLDMAGARSLRRIAGVDHIAAVDAARALFGGKDRLDMLAGVRSEEQTSELQYLLRNVYDVLPPDKKMHSTQ